MKSTLLRYSLFIQALCVLSPLWAQLPPLQPEQDCINALPVCQNVFVQANSYTGEGNDPSEINGANSCLASGERNDTWYIFTVQTGGNVSFVITPADPTDDYDWSVFNITNASCADIATDPSLEVNCNYSGIAGATGANTPGAPSVQGAGGTPFNGPIAVSAGETFVLNISNFSGTTTGYTLDFSASSASIFDNIPPQLQPLTANCGGSVNISFSENVLCSSVQASDFTLTGPGGPFTLTGITGDNCANGGTFEDEYVLTTSPPLTMPGTYTLTVVDTILDNCGNVCLFTSESFTFSPLTVTASASPAEICIGESTTLTTSVSSLPGYSFVWTPIGSTSPSPSVSPSGNTAYSVTVTDPDGCVTMAGVSVTVKPTPSASFLLAPSVCSNQSTSVIYTGNASPSATYQWDFGVGANPTGTGQGPYSVNWSSAGNKTVSLVVIENGCPSPEATASITVIQVPSSDIAGPMDVCEGDTAYFTYTGNAPATAAYAWTFNGAIHVENVNPPNTQGPYKVVWNTPGIQTACLQVDNLGCPSGLTCFNVNVKPKPEASIQQEANQCLNGNSFDFVYTGDMDVQSYNWNFGADAFPATSTDPVPPTVSYINPGVKTITLIVTRDGCTGDTAYMSFEVVPEPNADFNFSTSSICQYECITYSYTGTPVGIGQTYLWNFGPGAIPGSSTLENPGCITHAVDGSQTVSLIVTYKGCSTASSQTMTIHPGPIANAGSDVSFCDGEGGAQLDATVTGGTMPYYYSWSCSIPGTCGISDEFSEDPIANPNLVQAPDTVTYYFYATDFNGCRSNTDSVEVAILAKPLLDAGPDQHICAEGPGAFLQGGPAAGNQAPMPFDYMWSPSDGINDPTLPNPYARPDTTTIYTLQATAANGCTSDVTTLDTLSTVTVHVHDLPMADAGADTAVCLGESVQLQGFAAGSGPNYTYAWTPALPGTIDDPTSPSPTVSPTFTTYFYLVVRSNGCDSYADSVLVVVDTKPTLSPGIDETICLFDSVQLDGSAAGDPNGINYSYEWFPKTGLSDPYTGKPFASPNQTTDYSVIATSEFGCGSDADTITVTVEPTPIVLALNKDTIICAGDEIVLEAIHDFKTPPGSPVVYEWFPQDGSILTSPYVPTITVAPQTTTLYTVQTSVSGDCPTTDEVLVTVSPAINPTLTADTNRVCDGVSTQLHATGGLGNATFQWVPAAGLDDPNSTDPIATPSETTDYTVIISEGACVDSLSIRIDVNPLPFVDYLNSQGEGCEGLEVNFLENSVDGTNFIWDFGDGSPLSNEANPTHTYSEAGEYPVTLTVIGAGGCENSIQKATILIFESAIAGFTTQPEAPAELALPGASVAFSNTSEQAVQWAWDFGDGAVSHEMNPIHTYTSVGEYSVRLTVTDINGCTDQFQYGPFIVLSADLMIPNMFSPNGDGVNDRWIVQYSGSESFQLQIYDRWGRTFFTSDSPLDVWEGTDTQGALAHEGVYFYMIKVGEKAYRGDITLIR